MKNCKNCRRDIDFRRDILGYTIKEDGRKFLISKCPKCGETNLMDEKEGLPVILLDNVVRRVENI